MPGLIERNNGQRVISLTANLHGITLGEAAPQLEGAVAKAGAPPRGVTVTYRGQIPALDQTISGLRIGLLLAVLVIFLLLAANFQSLRLALAIILTIPATLCGVLLALRLTGTTLNIQSFMGAIMAIGIAVANSILLVTFAERFRHEGEPLAGSYSRGRGEPPARHSDDRRRDDIRDDSDGYRIRRGRWPGRAAGASRHWRADRIDVRDADHSALHLRDFPVRSLHRFRLLESERPNEPIL